VDSARARRPGVCPHHAGSGCQIVRAGGATGGEGRRHFLPEAVSARCKALVGLS
jgi:hypothetical protein